MKPYQYKIVCDSSTYLYTVAVKYRYFPFWINVDMGEPPTFIAQFFKLYYNAFKNKPSHERIQAWYNTEPNKDLTEPTIYKF